MSCSVSLNVCFESTSSVFIGGSQKGCDVVVVVFVDARLIIFLFIFSVDLIVGVEVAIHSSEFVTSESFGRGTDAYLRQDVTHV
jgi:hypothetical protein